MFTCTNDIHIHPMLNEVVPVGEDFLVERLQTQTMQQRALLNCIPREQR